MNLKLTLAALLIAPLALTACVKKDEAPKNETAETVAVEEKVTPEQQAVIDSIDQPVLDEKNTDIPAAVSNVDADAETPVVEEAASNATTH
ncbi:hypothetical protein [Acinetobacter sp. ANC 4973]|uniref:hypothetical protein n=1 Tax=Acinetobacter sp. ANC 4973 TaxID=1977871 RepID=UPI000A32FBD3|nr:hypothetical protein [Acinetobacter sp. ANC 4973]OTH00638.1 hypothetical protein B9T30_00755 [Acinetobacter sp. ANC 4973]